MRRVVRILLVAVVAALVAATLAGCGADPHLQRQAAAVRTRTCQSIIERQDRTRGPTLSPTRWLGEVATPPKRLTETINEREIVDGCLDVESQLAAARAQIDTLLHFFHAQVPPELPPTGAAAELLKLLRSGARS